jgi:hypothetical protein
MIELFCMKEKTDELPNANSGVAVSTSSIGLASGCSTPIGVETGSKFG